MGLPSLKLRILFATVFACGVLSTVAWGQTSRRAGPVELVELNDPRLTETQLLVIKSLRDEPPQTPVEILRAVKLTMDIDLYGDARFYLKQLADQGLGDDEMLQLQDAYGTDLMLEIHTAREMQPGGKASRNRF